MKSASRRLFLKTTAIAGATMMTSTTTTDSLAASNDSSQEQPPLKLGIVTYNIAKDWSVDEIIKNLTDLNIEGVELRDGHSHGVGLDMPKTQREEVKKKFASSPIKIVQMGSAYDFDSPDPGKLRESIEGAKRYAELTHDVGAPGMKVRPNRLHKDIPEEQTLEQIGKALAEVGKAAADLGIEVRLEVHGSETARLPRIRKIMDYANHPQVVVNWNSNMTDLEDGGFEAAFDLVKDKIRHVHITDLYNEYPWKQLFASLKAINYQGYCCAEIKESGDPLRLMRYYRALFLELQA